VFGIGFGVYRPGRHGFARVFATRRFQPDEIIHDGAGDDQDQEFPIQRRRKRNCRSAAAPSLGGWWAAAIDANTMAKNAKNPKFGEEH